MSNIGNAMNRFGLRRGIKGSKRKYIPQQKLFQHCMDVQAEVDSPVLHKLDWHD